MLCPPDYVAANNIAKVLSDEDLQAGPSARRSCSTTRARRAAATWPRSSATSRVTASRRASACRTTTELRLTLDKATYTLAALPRKTRLPLKRLAATIGEGLR